MALWCGYENLSLRIKVRWGGSARIPRFNRADSNFRPLHRRNRAAGSSQSHPESMAIAPSAMVRLLRSPIASFADYFSSPDFVI
ncbi:MAG TPA: hypothetical protein DDZ51_30250 [Planctomycetaceae bacterium]|nr:hypothetical protein [Planctomycetaceae bacterium]